MITTKKMFMINNSLKKAAILIQNPKKLNPFNLNSNKNKVKLNANLSHRIVKMRMKVHQMKFFQIIKIKQ